MIELKKSPAQSSEARPPVEKSLLERLRPVLDLETRDACHVLEVGSDKDAPGRQGVRGNRGVEVFDSFALAF